MFTFSFKHLQKLSEHPVTLDELLEILNLQGLEVKKVLPWQQDTAITIEVKANRAFCLSYLGLLRELAAFRKHKAPVISKGLPHLHFNNEEFPVAVAVIAKNACPKFAAVHISHIDNTVQTPLFIAELLQTTGINLINPVVDILNFIMLETGQPLHCYDLAKINKGIVVKVNKQLKTIRTLNVLK